MVKILHLADIHLETSFSNIKNVYTAKTLRNEQYNTLIETIKLAAKQGVEIVLIAGDLFDKTIFDYKVLNALYEYIRSYEHIYFFLCAGNHDYISENSLYLNLEKPDNLHIFTSNNIEAVVLEDLKTYVYGCSFNSSLEENNLLEGFCSEDDKYINIMLMHADFQSTTYNPITKQDICLSKLDYLALGHQHSFSGINKVDNTFYAYSGVLSGRGFDETNDKGYIIGDVDKSYINLRFEKTNARQYQIITVDISSIAFSYDLTALIESRLLNLKDIYRIVLNGEKQNTLLINNEELNNYFEDKVFYIEFVDNTYQVINYDEISKEHNLRGLFVKEMIEAINNSKNSKDKKQNELALKIGLESLGYYD